MEYANIRVHLFQQVNAVLCAWLLHELINGGRKTSFSAGKPVNTLLPGLERSLSRRKARGCALPSTFNLICFLLIFCFFALSFSYRRYALSKTDALLLRAAMIFTLLADFCMLIAGKNTLGVVFFCCVQFIYNYRFTNGKRAVALAAAIAVLAAALLFVPAAAKLASREKAAVVYAACLFFSVSGALLAFRRKKYPRPNNYLVLAGMLLFFLCDVSVMLFNLDLPQSARDAAETLIWVFYLPSQLMLSLSARKFGRKAR